MAHIRTWGSIDISASEDQIHEACSRQVRVPKEYGFTLSEDNVKEAIVNPIRLERRNDQLLALRPIDQEYAIRVVYRSINDNIVVLTFYPVKRERFRV